MTDLPAALHHSIKTISILGCGWYGLELAKTLLQQGYIVKGSSTTPEKLPLLAAEGVLPYQVDFQQGAELYDDAFFNTDLLLISIPPKRSTNEQSSFYEKILRISHAANQYKVRQLVFISSTSVYGDHNSAITAATPTAPDTDSGRAMVAAEELLLANKEFTTTIIRFAGLIGPGRNPGRFFAGKQEVPNGKAPVNLVHLEDCVGFIIAMIGKQTFGHIYNVCTPDHPERQAFYTEAAERSGLAVPTFKNELLQWKIITATPFPEKPDYIYRVDNLSAWLNSGS